MEKVLNDSLKYSSMYVYSTYVYRYIVFNFKSSDKSVTHKKILYNK